MLSWNDINIITNMNKSFSYTELCAKTISCYCDRAVRLSCVVTVAVLLRAFPCSSVVKPPAAIDHMIEWILIVPYNWFHYREGKMLHNHLRAVAQADICIGWSFQPDITHACAMQSCVSYLLPIVAFLLTCLTLVLTLMMYMPLPQLHYTNHFFAHASFPEVLWINNLIFTINVTAPGVGVITETFLDCSILWMVKLFLRIILYSDMTGTVMVVGVLIAVSDKFPVICLLHFEPTNAELESSWDLPLLCLVVLSSTELSCIMSLGVTVLLTSPTSKLINFCMWRL